MNQGFVVAGEALVDIVVAPSGQRDEAVGGSPMNVAVGLARLDVPALLITQIGDDDRGRQIADHVRASGAELSESSIVPGSATSTATARLDQDNAATYDFDLTWSLPTQPLPGADALHMGSLGVVLEPGRGAVLDLVRQADARGLFVSFDPNVRPAFLDDPSAGWQQLTEIAARSTLVKVSDEDLHALRDDSSVGDLAAELLSGDRTELVVVTRGGAGASAFTDKLDVEAAAPRVDVVDTVGAGDSFMAAALAILHGWQLPTAGSGAVAGLTEGRLRELLGGAMAAAAVTCSRRGANPPRRRELPPGWPSV